MQKFVLLSTVASAAAFLTSPAPEPAPTTDGVEPAPTTDGVEPAPTTEDAPLNEEEKKELEFTFEKPAAAEGAKKVQPKFKLQKKDFFTCPATGANLLGEKIPFAPEAGKSPLKQQGEFYEACQKACQQNVECAGLEIEYETYETPGGDKKLAITANKTAYDTAAGGFLKSCAMVGKTDPVQYGDLLKKVKNLTAKEEGDVAKRVEWVNKVDTVVKEALEKLGEAADARERAPEWNFEKAEKEAKKKRPTETLFAAVDSKSIYEEWKKDSPFQCVAYVNWENIPAQSLKKFLETREQKVTEIAEEVDAAEQGSAEAAKALSKLKFVKDQLAKNQLALDALKIDSAKSTEDLEKLKTKTTEAEEEITKQEKIKSGFKTQKGRNWMTADKKAIAEAKKIVAFEAEMKNIQDELAFQARLEQMPVVIGALLATAADKAKAVEVPSIPVKPSTSGVEPTTPGSGASGPTGPKKGSKVETPVKSSAETKKETKKTGCNTKLHMLWLLFLIPVGVAVFFIVKSKKSKQTRSIDDDDL